LESRPGGGSSGVAGCTLGSCCRGGADGPWVLEVLRRRARLMVISVKVGRRRCSICGLRYLCPWQRRVRRWKRQGPHTEWSRPVVFLGAEMECSAVVSLDPRARERRSRGGGARSPLPCGRGGGVLCRVPLFGGGVCVVVSALTCYVPIAAHF
jgi:hypothetical protein